MNPAAIRSRAAETAAAASRPNIVFLLADDLGSHDVGWRGSDIKTPRLDELALAGARLEQFYVQPVCSPTRARPDDRPLSFPAWIAGGGRAAVGAIRLAARRANAGAGAHEAGYQTAITGKWHLGHFQPAYLPTHRGFDHQYGHYNGAFDYFTHIRDEGFDWHRERSREPRRRLFDAH